MATIAKRTLYSLDRAIASIVEDANNGFCWFRGMSDSEYRLVPKVFREEYLGKENTLYREFIRDSRATVSGLALPRDTYDPKWFPLMQHYGLPTRCLDWSTSVSTALYFACANADGDISNPDAPGIIWLLNPSRLNEITLCQRYGTRGNAGLVGEDMDIVAEMMRAALLADERRLPDAFAFAPSTRTVREIAQKGVFTLHAYPTPLECDSESHTFLKAIVVPSRVKKLCVEALFSFGVDGGTLFPELPALAQRLSRRSKAK